jgi:hypothetical protein
MVIETDEVCTTRSCSQDDGADIVECICGFFSHDDAAVEHRCAATEARDILESFWSRRVETRTARVFGRR